MMPAGKLVRLVASNAMRSRKHVALSSFGIVVGIGAFVFFMALTTKVSAVLALIFPLEQVQVVAPRTQLAGKDLSKRLDDDIVKAIAARPEVATALPRMSMAFPSYGYGSFEGQELRFEVGGFSDGIDPAFVADDEALASLFKDWELEPLPKIRCVPAPVNAFGEYLADRYINTCPDTDRYYCDASDSLCHHRVPVIVSPTLLELYNGQFAKSHGLPILDQNLAKYIVEKGGLKRMRFAIGLGNTIVAGSNAGIDSRKIRQVEAALIGISKHALPIGMTVPQGYVRRWNQEFVGAAAAASYSSIVVTLQDKDRLAVFSQWLQDTLKLKLEDSLGEKFATVIFVIQMLFLLISVVIIAISAINISHIFFMQVSERRKELGLMRALGATPGDVLAMIVGEAALIGLIGGVVGVASARLGAALVNLGSAHYVPKFPYKPESWFAFEPWIWLTALGLAVAFAVIGGLFPARRAAQLEPAVALTQN